jgi:hypothetical protein
MRGLPRPLLAWLVIGVAGFVLVFAGQVALASFATANATRETAAIMRAIAEDIARRRW